MEMKEKGKEEKMRESVRKGRAVLKLATHSCNPSYSVGRDLEDHGLKSAKANSSPDPILKIPNTKKGWQSGSSCRVPA
jgi:hypothetical protein